MTGCRAGRGIENGNTEAAAHVLLDPRERGGELFRKAVGGARAAQRSGDSAADFTANGTVL